MKTIYLKKFEIDPKEFNKKTVPASKDELVLEENEVVLKDVDSGEVIAAVIPFNVSERTREEIRKIKWVNSERGSGLSTSAKVFGFQPRTPERLRPFCSKASLNKENPALLETLTNAARFLSNQFDFILPEEFLKMKNAVSSIKEEWKMAGSLYSSGIINNSNALAYHFDRGNVEGVFSAMITLKKNIEGGSLHLPAYKTDIFLPDNSVFFFDGQGILHGVRPFKLLRPDSYRYTIVFYALKEMWKCLSPKEEMRHAQKLREQIEQKRWKNGKNSKP